MYGIAGLNLSSGISIGVASIGYNLSAGVRIDKHGTYATASAGVYASAFGAVASFGAHYASLDGRINAGFDIGYDMGDLTPENKPVALEQDMTLVEVKATGSDEVYESTISVGGKEYSASSLPDDPNIYATIAPGEYNYEVVNHGRYGKSLMVNGGGAVPAVGNNPNRNGGNYGQSYATEIFVHRGRPGNYSGSQGCITVNPGQWNAFIENFEVGQTGKIRVIR
jgi:hypothetical protein